MRAGDHRRANIPRRLNRGAFGQGPIGPGGDLVPFLGLHRSANPDRFPSDRGGMASGGIEALGQKLTAKPAP